MNGEKKKKQISPVILLVALILGVVIVLAVRREKSEPPPAMETEKAVSATIQQTVCPIMGATINKDIFTEYKGKKVYFCCPGCKEKFEKEPEKYIGKLPQFKE